jgi:hypothetical protein
MRTGAGTLWWRWRERIWLAIGIALVLAFVAFVVLCVVLLVNYELPD